MKKIFDKKTILSFILGVLLCSGIVYGSNIYQSNAIEYSPTDSSWEVSNVNDAINSLYSMKNELDNTTTSLNNLKSIGDATAAQILSGKKAVVKGSTVTGTMTNRGAWTNIPTNSGKVTIPAGYHNGSGYVDISNVGNQIKTGTGTFGSVSDYVKVELGFKPRLVTLMATNGAYIYYCEDFSTTKASYYTSTNIYTTTIGEGNMLYSIDDTGFTVRARALNTANLDFNYIAISRKN